MPCSFVASYPGHPVLDKASPRFSDRLTGALTAGHFLLQFLDEVLQSRTTCPLDLTHLGQELFFVERLPRSLDHFQRRLEQAPVTALDWDGCLVNGPVRQFLAAVGTGRGLAG